MEVLRWESRNLWKPRKDYYYCTLTGQETDWVGVCTLESEREVFQTFKDECFVRNWGKKWDMDGRRKISVTGRFRRIEPDVYVTNQLREIGEGFYRVQIGAHCHTCIRVLDIGQRADEGREMNEVFLNEEGRTVYRRQYRGRRMGYAGVSADVRFPLSPKIVVDGCVYVQCDCQERVHDDITDVGFCLKGRSITPQSAQQDGELDALTGASYL